MKQDTKKQVQNLKKFFKKKILSIINEKSEVTVTFNQKDIIESLQSLRERPEFDFKQLNFTIDRYLIDVVGGVFENKYLAFAQRGEKLP